MRRVFSALFLLKTLLEIYFFDLVANAEALREREFRSLQEAILRDEPDRQARLPYG
jgi:hypothetical protein